MKRVLKYILRTLLALLLLVVLLAASLYLPPVQRWAVSRLTDYLEAETGLQVSIGSVHLSPLLDLRLGQVHVAQPPTDLIAAERLLVDLDLSRILSRHVGVEAIELSRVEAHMQTLIESVALDGKLGSLRLVADDIDLREKKINVSEAMLDGCDLDLTLRQTADDDTTQSEPVDWKIDVEQIIIRHSNVKIQDEPLSFMAEAAIRDARLAGGDIDLRGGAYRAGRLSIAADSIRFSPSGQPQDAFALNDIGLSLDAFSYDATRLDLEGLNIKTPNSFVKAKSLSYVAPKGDESGQEASPSVWSIDGSLNASLGQADVLSLAGRFMPKDLVRHYPRQPINLELVARGNTDRLSLAACNVQMPTVVDARASGELWSLTDSLRRGADMKADIATMDLNFVSRWLGLDDVRFPRMTLHADIGLRDASKLKADALLKEGRGTAHVVGNINLSSMTYQAKARIAGLNIHDFLPKDSIYGLTATLRASGHGTDFLSTRTALSAEVDIDHLGYASWNLDSISADCRLEKGSAMLELNSRNSLLGMQGCVDAAIEGRKLKAAAFNMDVSSIDLFRLGLTKKPFSASMVMHVDGASDFMQTHSLKARVEAIELTTADSIFHPLDLTLDADLTPESIRAKALSGDLSLSLSSGQGLDSLLLCLDNLSSELSRQIDSLRIRQDTLRTLLPRLQADLTCGQKNPIGRMIREATGYSFRDLSLHLLSSPDSGLNGNGHMYSLNTGAILLDSIYWDITQGAQGLALDARISNGKKNPIVSFLTRLHADLTETGANTQLVFFDAKGQKGMDFGLALELLHDGVTARFTPLNPIIAYRGFTLNKDNFITRTNDGRLEALVDLLADDGTGLKLYTTPNDEAQQDVSLSINRFNVGELTSVVPFMPDISGFLHGDVHYMQADSTTTVSSELTVSRMAYNGVRLGDVGLNAIYFPNADGSHFVDGIVSLDGRDVLLVSGKYHDEELTGDASFQGLPFSLANALMPDGPLALTGYAWGDFSVKGKTSDPILNGELRTDSLHIKADSYSVDLQIPDHSITVSDSRLSLNRLEAYAAGKTPLTLDGTIDFSDLDRMQLDITVRAKDYQLINAPKRQGSLAYGKVIVDLGARFRGTPDDLQMRGRLDVQGGTDVSLVLTETPLANDDQLADIVTFTDLSDTVRVDSVVFKRQNIDMQMNVNIAETAQMHCFLSDNGNDYIDLQGGGELTLSYDLQDDIGLWGRYTINKGTMRYSLMAIPLNDFRIAEGSYVEFQGNMMNPRLSIQASERTRSTVTENSQPRNVAFDVGLAISRTLDDMGLEFTLEAPEDMTVQNQLTAMTAEERGRVAVTMLVTGMYVTDNGETNGGYNYTNTLNAYLQSAINEVAGKALSTVDVNFGVQSGTSETGTNTTDYSFSFAKRFWGNRISVIIGGKVSTGQDAVNTGQTIIDNVAIEYRLDKSASRYVNIFYDRNFESLLEGQVTKMGGGIVLRKKSERLGELFIFRKKEEGLPPDAEKKDKGKGD